eukprot:1974-Heterococcus_DN1.PRE.1
MGNYLHPDWTPPEHIAEQLVTWLKDPVQRPPSGSIVLVNTVEGQTSWQSAKLKTELEML